MLAGQGVWGRTRVAMDADDWAERTSSGSSVGSSVKALRERLEQQNREQVSVQQSAQPDALADLAAAPHFLYGLRCLVLLFD
mgnify:CR=1 FL=1